MNTLCLEKVSDDQLHDVRPAQAVARKPTKIDTDRTLINFVSHGEIFSKVSQESSLRSDVEW